jgi:signal transduction histidine kinase
MSFEKRVLSLLNILAAVAIPVLLVIIHLPHPETIDYSVIYMVLGSLAFLFIVGNLLITYPSSHGRVLEQIPTFFLGVILYGFIISMGIYFSGGLESPLYYAALIGPLLAGVCFRPALALTSTTITALFYTIAIFFSSTSLKVENTQTIVFNLAYLYLACILSTRLSLEMLRHEQAKDEATNLSNFIRKLEKAKTEFVSVVSHELRTPLTSIQGFSEFLITRELTKEKKQEFYEIINNEAERLGRLITNLLNLSKIETGIELNKETLDLVELLSEDIDLVQSQTNIHKVTFNPADRIPYVYADKDRLHQVIKNILSNATKYSPEGGAIDVYTGVDGKYVWFSVSDRGIGIPAEDLPFIFERFRRVEKGAAAAISGTGLGLAIVKHLVEMHGGRIVVRSELRAGSTFLVYLPIRGE